MRPHDPNIRHDQQPGDDVIEQLLHVYGEAMRASCPEDLASRIASASWAERSMPIDPLPFVAPAARTSRRAWLARVAMAAAIGLAFTGVLRPGNPPAPQPDEPSTTVAVVDTVVHDAAADLSLTMATLPAEQTVEPLISTYGVRADAIADELELLVMNLDV